MCISFIIDGTRYEDIGSLKKILDPKLHVYSDYAFDKNSMKDEECLCPIDKEKVSETLKLPNRYNKYFDVYFSKDELVED